MTKAKQPTTYTVEFTIIVDHPEKRCETLPKVFAGTFINTSSSHPNQGAAVKMSPPRRRRHRTRGSCADVLTRRRHRC